MLKKTIVFFLCFCLLFEQTGLAQIVIQVDMSSALSGMLSCAVKDKFRPMHLRYLSYDVVGDDFKLLLDKGDSWDFKEGIIENSTKELLKSFFVGVVMPNDSFWVNLRPDSPDEIIDDSLAATDVGRALLAADLQLKKDTAAYTSPKTREGREYWDMLYKKAEDIYGTENITIPTLTRPWIVPDEIIVRESGGSVYIYKATLKVMLEQDYLKDSISYQFKDGRAKQLNEYSSELIRSLIIPKLTQEVNSSKRYAELRQLYYSLILAHWFKKRFGLQALNMNDSNSCISRIDTKDLTGLSSKTAWAKETYFKAYQKSFKEGEYNIKESHYSAYGQTIKSFFSGGLSWKEADFAVALNKGQQVLVTKPFLPIQAQLPFTIGGQAKVNPQERFDIKVTMDHIEAKDIATPRTNSRDSLLSEIRNRDGGKNEEKTFEKLVNNYRLYQIAEILLKHDTLRAAAQEMQRKKLLNAESTLRGWVAEEGTLLHRIWSSKKEIKQARKEIQGFLKTLGALETAERLKVSVDPLIALIEKNPDISVKKLYTKIKRVQKIERIKNALRVSSTKKEAADQLGMSYAALWMEMKRTPELDLYWKLSRGHTEEEPRPNDGGDLTNNLSDLVKQNKYLFFRTSKNANYVIHEELIQPSVSAGLLNKIDAVVLGSERDTFSQGWAHQFDFVDSYDHFDAGIRTMSEKLNKNIYYADLPLRKPFRNTFEPTTVKALKVFLWPVLPFVLMFINPAIFGPAMIASLLISLGTVLAETAEIPLLTKIFGYLKLFGFYTPDGLRSAATAEKIEKIIIPQLKQEIMETEGVERNPNILISYGYGYRDIAFYARHKWLRNLVLLLHSLWFYFPYDFKYRNTVEKLVYQGENRQPSNPRINYVAEKTFYNNLDGGEDSGMERYWNQRYTAISSEVEDEIRQDPRRGYAGPFGRSFFDGLTSDDEEEVRAETLNRLNDEKYGPGLGPRYEVVNGRVREIDIARDGGKTSSLSDVQPPQYRRKAFDMLTIMTGKSPTMRALWGMPTTIEYEDILVKDSDADIEQQMRYAASQKGFRLEPTTNLKEASNKIKEKFGDLPLRDLTFEIISKKEFGIEPILVKDSSKMDGGNPQTAEQSSALQAPGGIDFRALPITTQPIEQFLLKEISNLPSINIVSLEKEWQSIQKMVKANMIPSCQRIKEFLGACYKKGELSRRMDAMLACFAEILRREEEDCKATEPEMKNMLVLLENSR